MGPEIWIWIWRQKNYLNLAPKKLFEFGTKNLNLNLAPKTWIWIWRQKFEFEFGALTLAGLLRDEACVCYFIERKPSKEGRQSDFDSSCSFWERKHFLGGEREASPSFRCDKFVNGSWLDGTSFEYFWSDSIGKPIRGTCHRSSWLGSFNLFVSLLSGNTGAGIYFSL